MSVAQAQAVELAYPSNPGRGKAMLWFSFALVAAYLCRGVILCCILPPMEMWDEYQHFARIAYLHEMGRSPVFQETDVPVSVMEQVAQYPQPVWNGKETIPGGGKTYSQFWLNSDRPKFHPGPPPPLYEAQQAPLYYWLMLPIFNAAGGTDHTAVSVSVLRLVNVGFGAAALAVILAWAAWACRQRRYAMAIGLWAGLHPLLLLNSTRVANDSLAFLLAVIVVAWTLVLSGRRLQWHAAAIGVLTGLGILTKATDLALVPFVLLCFLAIAWRKETKWPGAAVAAAILILIVAAEISPIVIDSFRHFGVPFPIQEAVYNHAHGVKISALLVWLRRDHWWVWWSFCQQCFLDGGLWVGGWSILLPPRLFIVVYQTLLLVALLGWPAAWLFRRERLGVSSIFRRAGTAPAIVALVCCVLAELSVHAVESMTALGVCSTAPWYAAPALPWLLAVLATGALAWRHTRLGYWVALIMPAFFVLVEFFDEFGRMVATYSQKSLSVAALSRLGSLHPAWLRFPTLAAATPLALILLATAFGLCLTAFRRRDEA
jgi:4-amino-4-deoxy-L-arabinose transferase-like glycosyltransferase